MIVVAPLWGFLALLAVHWVADFILQTHWQAQNKSKRLDALAMHVGSYTIALCVGTITIFAGSATGMKIAIFTVVNGAIHFATDFFTSRWTSKLYAKQDWHNFFAVVGLDQLIHQTTLAVTMWALFP